MLSNLMPLVFNKKALNHKFCHSIGDVLGNYSHGVVVLFAFSLHKLPLYMHTGTGMYGALCLTTMQNYLIYLEHFPMSHCLCS